MRSLRFISRKWLIVRQGSHASRVCTALVLRFAIALPFVFGFAENVSRLRRFWHKFAVVNGFWSHIETYLNALSSAELLTWPFRKRFLRSKNFIVHNRKFVPKREGNGHVHDRVHRIIPGCGRYRLCGNGVAAEKPLSRKQTPTSRKRRCR